MRDQLGVDVGNFLRLSNPEVNENSSVRNARIHLRNGKFSFNQSAEIAI